MDFISIPQLCAVGGGTSNPGYYDSNNGGDGELEQTLQNLKEAVESIPSYVEKSTLFLILAPVCLHRDRQEVCSYATWRKRGWCRLELQAARLKSGQMCMLLCKGSEAKPVLMHPRQAAYLAPGAADFTCCQRNHMINGKEIPCDRQKVRSIMGAMIQTKTQELKDLGQMDALRYFVSYASFCLIQGLPLDCSAYFKAYPGASIKDIIGNQRRDPKALHFQKRDQNQDALDSLKKKLS